MYVRIIVLLLCLIPSSLFAQYIETFPLNDIKDTRSNCYAFTHATIVKSSKEILIDANLIIRQGKIESVGKYSDIPKDAIVIPCYGLWIYPSFIELFSDYGIETAKAANPWDENNQQESNIKGAFGWNQAIHSHFLSSVNFKNNASDAETLRKLGFGLVLTHRKDGIVRGSGSLVSLQSDKENINIIAPDVASILSFNKGSSTQDYPSSLMGSIALLRQTYLDAMWYKEVGHKQQYNISLDQFNALQNKVQIFDASDRQNIFRALKISKEFNKTYIIKGNGSEYQSLDELRKENVSLIVPINFPQAYDVEDPLVSESVSLAEMKHWELAPFNASLLANEKINFTLTTADLKSKTDFKKNLLKAVKAGLSSEDALKALTETPAKMLGVYNQVGSLDQGKLANFFICSGDFFKDKTIMYQHWIQGKKNVVQLLAQPDIRGTYLLNTSQGETYTLKVEGSNNELKLKVEKDTNKLEGSIERKEQLIQFSFVDGGSEKEKNQNFQRFQGWLQNDVWYGTYTNHKGQEQNWTAHRTKTYEDKPDTAKTKYLQDVGQITYPLSAYGFTQLPKEKTVLIKNTTVWTNEKDGIVKNHDVLIRNGRIARVGKDINVNDAEVIDGSNKHLTNGIIDEHSHIAIQWGVNEGTQASSAEVRIGDVIDAEDINIYRNLAGGVTSVQLLHGSANPIGGQSALIKLRWGLLPEQMKIKDADGFIKFALGENVKQSNWGDKFTTRFPQTRMGVEQVYENYFQQAKEYGSQRLIKPSTTRRDLELEALYEIINKKRFISCHSYMQAEITMLMRVAEHFNFKVNTFTHILEGYKVADKMKAHGVGASTFSDWWAYKFEVYDAIPHNASILNAMGVVTAMNSDDAEMARRLNQEAAKAVKYGNTSEEDAWKMVTLNPAKLLHLDKNLGSIKEGKDADLVLWSDNPLSVYAKVEKTFVDGICYYDKKTDETMRLEIASERNRLIQKMLNAKKNGDPVQKVAYKRKPLNHCMGEDQDH